MKKSITFIKIDITYAHKYTAFHSLPMEWGESWEKKCKTCVLRYKLFTTTEKEGKNNSNNIYVCIYKMSDAKFNCSSPTNWCPDSSWAAAAPLANSPQFYSFCLFVCFVFFPLTCQSFEKNLHLKSINSSTVIKYFTFRKK